MQKAFGGLKYKALCKKYYLSFCKIKGLAFTRPTFMPAKGFEPSLSHLNSDLNAARLPIPPSGHFSHVQSYQIFGKM